MRSFRSFRRPVVLVALLAYSLPAAGAVVADLAHEIGHVAEVADRQRARAGAIGLDHAGASELERDPVGDLAVVHSHGGSTHGHGPVIAMLLEADEADDPESGAIVLKITPHLGTASPAVPSSPSDREARAASQPSSILWSHPAPAPPPPRG